MGRKIKQFWNNESKEIKAKFNSTYPDTGKKINKGEQCLYIPANKKCYHVSSITYYNFRNQAMDQGEG